MYKKLIWYMIIVLFLIGLGLFSKGFYLAFQIGAGKVQVSNIEQDKNDREKEEIGRDMKDENNPEFLVLGDSLSRGTGDEQGKGFAGNVVEILRDSSGVHIVLNNASVEGMKSEGLLNQLSDSNIRQGIKNAEMIFISIGGNDLRAVQRLEAVQREQSYHVIAGAYKENIRKIVASICDENPKGIIVFLGLYNLDYGVETLAEAALLMEWNYHTQEIIEADGRAIYIPTYDLFKLNDGRFMSPDGLHPNSLGYEAIGKRMADVIKPLFTTIQ